MTFGPRPHPIAAAARWMSVAARTTALLPAAAALSFVDTRRSQSLMRSWATSCTDALGLTTTVQDDNHGRYDDPPYLFVHLNQASLIESFLYMQFIPMRCRIVMNFEFAMIPVLGSSLVATGSRVIVRQRPAQAKRVMSRVARDMADKGHAYALSVEGRRSPDGRLSPFKRGAAVLAIQAQARIVPLFIQGSHRVLPMGQWRARPGPVHGRLLPAIDTRGLTYDDRIELTERLRGIGEAEMSVYSPGR